MAFGCVEGTACGCETGTRLGEEIVINAVII